MNKTYSKISVFEAWQYSLFTYLMLEKKKKNDLQTIFFKVGRLD